MSRLVRRSLTIFGLFIARIIRRRVAMAALAPGDHFGLDRDFESGAAEAVCQAHGRTKHNQDQSDTGRQLVPHEQDSLL
jgi:hypothetical protein